MFSSNNHFSLITYSKMCDVSAFIIIITIMIIIIIIHSAEPYLLFCPLHSV